MGAPTASLVTTGNNSWVLGVGNDYDNAVTRSVPTGQTLLHQDLTSSGDTYWAQMQASAVPAAGTTVAINDTAPTKDRYNLAIVEVLAGAGGTNAVPPTVPMTARAADATVAGQTTLAANATDRWSSGPSSNTTFVLDMTQASPAWKQTASMAYPRSFLNLTMLPDGNVLATGGETDRNGGTIANAVYSAEMWSPTTQTWSTMAFHAHTPRISRYGIVASRWTGARLRHGCGLWQCA